MFLHTIKWCKVKILKMNQFRRTRKNKLEYFSYINEYIIEITSPRGILTRVVSWVLCGAIKKGVLGCLGG